VWEIGKAEACEQKQAYPSTMPSSPPETAIDTARRHVHRAEFLFTSQEALVAQLLRDGHDELADQGCSILDTLGTSLALARADLAELEGTRRPSFLEAVALRYAQFSNKT
jgi:hypothetical protein